MSIIHIYQYIFSYSVWYTSTLSLLSRYYRMDLELSHHTGHRYIYTSSLNFITCRKIYIPGLCTLLHFSLGRHRRLRYISRHNQCAQLACFYDYAVRIRMLPSCYILCFYTFVLSFSRILSSIQVQNRRKNMDTSDEHRIVILSTTYSISAERKYVIV